MGVLRLGILGAGCIGRRVAQACLAGELQCAVGAVLDRKAEAAASLAARCGPPAAIAASLADLASQCDVLVECAHPGIVPEAVRAGEAAWLATEGRACRHLLVMSVGGLLEVPGLAGWPPCLSGEGPVLHVPSGAIGALDAIQALAVAGLDEVRLTTRKPPAGLGLAVSEETTLFEGSAREVIARYPKNVNVAVALSFAGIGPDKTLVRLVADPGIERNTHSIYARGAAGEVEFTSRNLSFPDNPATSYLAALSAVSLLRRIAARLQVG